MGGSAVIVVRIQQLHREPEAWPRHTLDPGRVGDFRQLYLDEGLDALPLIEVIADPIGDYLIADGNHRYEALSQTDIDRLRVIELGAVPGIDEYAAAFERGLLTASRSSLPLSRAERHDAIRHLKASRPDLSNHEIGDLVGCSHQTVGRVLSRSNGPAREDEEEATAWPPTDLEVASQILSGIERVYAARGLGIWDALTSDHTGERLAEVIVDSYGDHALRFAERIRGWVDEAITVLEGRP
jgi:hypothetical protein